MCVFSKQDQDKTVTQPLPDESESMAAAARIFIVDDFPIVRDGLAQIINQQPGLNCVGGVGSSSDTLTFLNGRDVDLVIADISLGHENGLDLISRLHQMYPRLRMLALSMHNESLYAEYALSNGARGYVMKEEVTESIVNALHCILDGGIYLSDKMTRRLLSKLDRASTESGVCFFDSLTQMQRTIFEMTGRGCPSEVIVSDLDLSPVELEEQIKAVKIKLGIKSTSYLEALAVLFVRHG